jgi:hypothetical protein
MLPIGLKRLGMDPVVSSAPGTGSQPVRASARRLRKPRSRHGDPRPWAGPTHSSPALPEENEDPKPNRVAEELQHERRDHIRHDEYISARRRIVRR